MNSFFKKLGVAVVLALSFGASANANSATTTVLSPLDRGTYNWDGNHRPGRDEILIDEYVYNNFFVFDLAGVDFTNLQSVTLIADSPYTEMNPGVTATYTLYDVTTAIPDLLAGGTGHLNIFNDLGQGTVYGSRSFQIEVAQDMIDNLTGLTVTFNADGIAALKAAGGLFAFGGTLKSNDPAYGTFLFGDNTYSNLVLTYNEVTMPVPEADTSALILAGGLLLAGTARRRNLN